MAKESGKKAKKKKKVGLPSAEKAKPAAAARTKTADSQEEPRLDPSGGQPAASPSKRSKVLRAAQKTSAKLAEQPVMVEVVAAVLVGAAAALRNPAEARRMAAAAAPELESAAEGAGKKASAYWQLGLDIARRSIEAIGGEEPKSGLPTHRSVN